MVFATHGKGVAQETAVKRLFGSSYKCERANLVQIVQTITGEWRDWRGVPFNASARMLPKSGMAIAISPGSDNNRPPGYIDKMWASSGGAREIVHELANGRPLINAADSHATVIVGATYQQDELFDSGPIGLNKIIVLDPWPDSKRIRELTAEEISRQILAVAISVS